MNYLPYFVQIFLKLAVLAVFQNFPNRFFFLSSESVRTMFDELSRIVAVLRHYDSVRIAQGVRGLGVACCCTLRGGSGVFLPGWLGGLMDGKLSRFQPWI